MSDEVNEIWLQHCSIGKVFYVVTRYTNFLDAIILIWCTWSTMLVNLEYSTAISFADSFDAGLTTEVRDTFSKNYIIRPYEGPKAYGVTKIRVNKASLFSIKQSNDAP